MARKNSEDIAATIRERICLAPSEGFMVLHEGHLAEEFGVSRTPVRQVLQMLAYEGLVETRSGVGTIVSPLSPANRGRDETAFIALLRAAMACPVPEGGNDVAVARGLLARLQQGLSEADISDRQTIYRVMLGAMTITSGLVGDDIVRTALRAAWLRHIRWTFQGLEQAPDSEGAQLLQRLRERLMPLSSGQSDAGPAGAAPDCAGMLRLLAEAVL